MFGIFKRKKTIEFLYPDLKPNDRIREILTGFILPELEPFGFKLLKSELTFKRDIGDFQHTIHFQKTRWNSGNEVCKFKPHFGIYSNALKKYYILNGTKISGNILIHNRQAEHLECWNQELYKNSWYDLVNYDNYKVVNILKDNILSCGMEFFKHSESEIVDYIMSLNSYYYLTPTLFDICKMFDRKEKASELLKWFRDFQKNPEKKFSEDILKSVTERENELKNWL